MESSGAMTLNWVFYVTAAAFGAVIGSFLNVLIHRGPAFWKLVDDETRGDLISPRSYCPSCRKTIRSVHLIPLASYMMLGGKCANCGASIALRYPLVELAGALSGVAALALFGLSMEAAGVFFFFMVMIALAAIDAETGYLPDMLTLPLLIIGIIANAFDLFNATLGGAVLGVIIGYGAFRLVDIVFLKLRGIEGLGQGDAKLLAAIGAWFGWPVLPPVVFLAAIFALIGVGIASLRGAKIGKETPVPFGPALAAAAASAMIAHGLRLPYFA
ncbi:prepilin peptidase [Marinicaulis aureus]|uniref:Prepilin leader peptidase/N-methyltransferase n=1 Tax=Hyphococcus aureus TaxID=2666033 RepID=A0ABW1L1D0_9PROT